MTRSSVSDEAGFTLVELLVAMIAATVVLFALSTVLVNTLRQTQRTFTRVDATRQGRTAIADIENELHSACLGAGQAPIQGAVSGSSQVGSSGTSLVFVSSYGAAVTPTPVWHVITYSSTAHTLTAASYGVTGSAPNWAPTGQPSSNQLLSNVTQRVNGSGTAIPVFQYFAYQAASTDAGGTSWIVPDGAPNPATGAPTPSAPLAPGGTLSAGQAAATVEVLINLSVGATSESLNNQSLSAVNDQVDDAISLRLTTPPDEVPGTTTVAAGTVPPGYGPCE